MRFIKFMNGLINLRGSSEQCLCRIKLAEDTTFDHRHAAQLTKKGNVGRRSSIAPFVELAWKRYVKIIRMLSWRVSGAEARAIHRC